MPQVNTLSMGCKFKFNNELSSKPQIIYNTRARVKQKRKKRSTNPSNLNTKIEQVRLNNFYNEEISSDDEIFLKNSNNSKCVWTKNNDNDDFFTPLDLWADQINPFISYPLCILDHTPNQHNNISTKYPIIFVNNISLHNLLSELSSQIPQIEDELFCDFDWDKISNSCGLAIRACREIWWSIDDRIIPILDGYLIILDMKHYKELDSKIILQCKKRIKTLINFAMKYNIHND